eukprot:34424-Amphidinium_carterae.1
MADRRCAIHLNCGWLCDSAAFASMLSTGGQAYSIDIGMTSTMETAMPPVHKGETRQPNSMPDAKLRFEHGIQCVSAVKDLRSDGTAGVQRQ